MKKYVTTHAQKDLTRSLIVPKTLETVNVRITGMNTVESAGNATTNAPQTVKRNPIVNATTTSTTVNATKDTTSIREDSVESVNVSAQKTASLNRSLCAQEDHGKTAFAKMATL